MARMQVDWGGRKAIEGLRPLRTIAVTGAKGGVGATMLGANLAIYLATIGRRVLFVDADPAGANGHAFLGVDRPDTVDDALADPQRLSELQCQTRVPGLDLLVLGVDEPRAAGAFARGRPLLHALKQLPIEYAVLDLGAGVEPDLLDLMHATDLALHVTSPEPTAVENSYRFLRTSFFRKLRALCKDAKDRDRLDALYAEAGGAPAPVDLALALEEGSTLSELANELLGTQHPPIVVNQARVASDLLLGEQMRSAARCRLGVSVDYLGHVDFDDAVWTCLRGRRPLLVESPGTKASRCIEKVARRLIGARGIGPSLWFERDLPPGSHHDLLEVERGATEEEIRRAFRRARDIYDPEAICTAGLFLPGELEALTQRIEEAYEVLMDPARRRPYELALFPDEEIIAQPITDEDWTGAPPAPPVVTADTEFTGALLQAVRKGNRVPLREIARRTKITLDCLHAIEADDFAALPPVAYVRGFVSQVAKCLALDPAQVSRSYVKRYRAYLAAR